MKTKDWLLLGMEAMALTGFISCVLCSVYSPVTTFVGTLALVTLGYIAVLSRLSRF